jgi:D-psicose/D-tagatose/L-ribulose 3-epimerase
VIRFGMHSSLWTSAWTREGAETSVTECARHGLEVVEIALLEPNAVDVQHSLSLFERYGVAPTASLCLPEAIEATRHPQEAQAFLGTALDVAHALGSNTLTGVTYSALGYRSGAAPTEAEYDAIARALKPVAKRAANYGMTLGLETLQPLRDPPAQHRSPSPRADRPYR